MPQEIARQWFVPGEGIERQVISADIQRYLGNDATVRPGQGNGENQGVPGFWIKAYRNLTSAMIADLQADSARYRQEQRQSSARGSQSPVMYDVPVEASGVDGPAYGLSHPPGRIPVPDNRMSDRMMLDPPGPPAGRGHHNGNYPGDSRPYPPADRGYPAESRPVNVPGSNGASWTQSAGRGSIPVSQPYPADQPRYPASYAPPDDGAPPGYVRQGGYYVPVGSYAEPSPLSSRSDYVSPPPHAGAFGQPPFGGREPRDGRFAAPPPVSDYPDASYHATAPPQPAGYTRPYDNRQKYR